MKAITGAALCLVASMDNTNFVQAAAKDLCTPGSDAQCSRLGANMCCAHITYTFKQEQQDFHACASRLAIENGGNSIYDENGFIGYWYCDEAFYTTASILATTFIVAFNAI